MTDPLNMDRSQWAKAVAANDQYSCALESCDDVLILQAHRRAIASGCIDSDRQGTPPRPAPGRNPCGGPPSAELSMHGVDKPSPLMRWSPRDHVHQRQ